MNHSENWRDLSRRESQIKKRKTHLNNRSDDEECSGWFHHLLKHVFEEEIPHSVSRGNDHVLRVLHSVLRCNVGRLSVYVHDSLRRSLLSSATSCVAVSAQANSCIRCSFGMWTLTIAATARSIDAHDWLQLLFGLRAAELTSTRQKIELHRCNRTRLQQQPVSETLRSTALKVALFQCVSPVLLHQVSSIRALRRMRGNLHEVVGKEFTTIALQVMHFLHFIRNHLPM